MLIRERCLYASDAYMHAGTVCSCLLVLELHFQSMSYRIRYSWSCKNRKIAEARGHIEWTTFQSCFLLLFFAFILFSPLPIRYQNYHNTTEILFFDSELRSIARKFYRMLLQIGLRDFFLQTFILTFSAFYFTIQGCSYSFEIGILSQIIEGEKHTFLPYFVSNPLWLTITTTSLIPYILKL